MDNKDFEEQFNFKEFESFENFDFGNFGSFDMNLSSAPGTEPEEEKGFFGVFRKIMGKEEPKAEVKSEDPFKMDFDFDFDFSMPEMPPMDMGSFEMELPGFEAFPGFETGKGQLEEEHKKAALEAKRIERKTRAAEKAARRASRKERTKAEAARHREEYIPKIEGEIEKRAAAFGMWIESGKESWTGSWEEFSHEQAARKADRLTEKRNRALNELKEEDLRLRERQKESEKPLAKSEGRSTYSISGGFNAVKSRASNAYYTWAVVWDQLDEEKELKRTDRITAQHNRENRVH